MPAKRRTVAESKRDENVAIPSNIVCKTEEPAENTFLRVRPIEELQENLSSQLHSCDAISRTSSGGPSTSGIDDSSIEAFQNEIDSAAELIIDSDGKVDLDELYHCAFPECDWARGNEIEFLAHLSIHDWSRNYQCYHCQRQFNMVVKLKKHIKFYHQKCHFFCFYCEYMSVTAQEMDKHFNDMHTCKSTSTLPLNANNYDTSTDLFVVCPINADLDEFNKRLMERANNLKRRKFLPIEIESLPKNQIFREKLECGLCGFSTKVRQNLVQHFKYGCNEPQPQIPIVAVNRTGSNEVRDLMMMKRGLSKFIPKIDRYRCFARSCGHRYVSPGMLQQHMDTFHKLDHEFFCPHCGKVSKTFSTVKQVLNHLRFHRSRICKCPSCPFIHYSKRKVDKHIGKTHPNVRERTIDQLTEKREPVKVAASKESNESFEWSGDNCSATFKLVPLGLVKTHILKRHDYAKK